MQQKRVKWVSVAEECGSERGRERWVVDKVEDNDSDVAEERERERERERESEM